MLTGKELARTYFDGLKAAYYSYDGQEIWDRFSSVVHGADQRDLDRLTALYPDIPESLVELLKHTISAEEFNPFSGILYSQNGVVQDDPNRVMLPEEIMTMDWLAENVIGSIPKKEELKEQAEPVIKQQGITSGS